MITFDDINYTENKDDRTQIEKVIKSDDNININIIVKESEFNNTINNDGGAIHLINCGITCEKTVFNECISNKGGGGAIYVKNPYELVNNVVFKGLTFNDCKADYGGAAFVYSSSIKNEVNFISCKFNNNVASIVETEDGFYDGSAIFLSAAAGIIKRCVFKNNSVKVTNNYADDKSYINSKTLLNQDRYLISDCTFYISKDLKNSLFYCGCASGTSLEIKSCIFDGELGNDSHFIDGKILKKNSPKVFINSCRFSSNVKDAFSFDLNNDFVSINIKDQVFEFNDHVENKKTTKSSWKFNPILAASVCALAVILAAALVIMMIKKNENKFIVDDELSNENKDNQEISLTAPLI